MFNELDLYLCWDDTLENVDWEYCQLLWLPNNKNCFVMQLHVDYYLVVSPKDVWLDRFQQGEMVRKFIKKKELQKTVRDMYPEMHPPEYFKNE